jgi:hypothetical protein
MRVFYALGILHFNGVVSGESIPTTRSHSPAVTGLPFRFFPRGKIHFPMLISLWQSNGKVEKLSCVPVGLDALRGFKVLCSVVSNARGMHPSAGNVPHDIADEMTRELIEAGFKVLAKKFHPDMGGRTQKMQELNAVMEKLLR